MAERQLRSISRQGSEAGGDDDERLAALPAEVALCESLKRLQERLAEERRIRGTQANDRVSTQSQLNQISQQKEALRAEAQALMASLVEARAERADLSAREAEARRRATEFEERLRAMEAAKAALEADLKVIKFARGRVAMGEVADKGGGGRRGPIPGNGEVGGREGSYRGP